MRKYVNIRKFGRSCALYNAELRLIKTTGKEPFPGREIVWGTSQEEEVRPVDQRSPAEQLQEFLNFVDSCSREYQAAYGAVNEEDKRLQDLIHEMEFAENKAERNKVATRLQHSRRNRRKNKDIVMRNELVVKFFDEQNHKSTLNKMRQLLGRQRKEEEFLQSKRTYKPRMKGE